VKQQTEVRNFAQNALQRLCKAQPAAKAAVEHARRLRCLQQHGSEDLAGGLWETQRHRRRQQTKKETFMKMIELQAGLGTGVKKFNAVFVFDNDKVLNSFINSGWEFGGQTTAAAKTSDKGGAMAGAASVSDGVWMYQMTEKAWPLRSLPRTLSTTKMMI
jgi:hypothetical protein